jgi:hypothetical protein
MSSIDISELDDENESRRDFRRANGAPLVSDPENPEKTLRYSRPSSYAKCLDDEEALVNWRLFKAMDGVARSPALQTQIVACKDDDRVEKKMLRERALDRGNANERADQGTGLHAILARIDDATDVDFSWPPQYDDDISAYRNAIDEFGLIPEMIEVPFVHDVYRAAGTADRIYRLSKPLLMPNGRWLDVGELVCGDLKTGKKLDFSLPGYAVQLAIYAQGKLYDVVTERRLPTPPISHAFTILVHLPVGSGRCEMRWCSVETGNYGAWLASEVRQWRNRWKKGEYDAPLIPEPTEVVSVTLAPEGAIEVDIDMMLNWCRRRTAAIAAHEGAREWLVLRWPAGLPTPKQGGHTWEQVDELVELLDRTEAQFSIPFGDPDPRLIPGVHKSKVLSK